MVSAPTLSTRVDEWIWANARLNVPSVNNNVYPEDNAPINGPYVQFSMLSGMEVMGMNGTRVMLDSLYIIQAIAETGDFKVIEPISDQIYNAFHRKFNQPTANATILSSVCEEEIRRALSTEAGTRYRYLGFRVRIQAVSN